MSRCKDGWHTIQGYEVYIENGIVKRGVKYDNNGSALTAYPFKVSKYGGYESDPCVTVAAFSVGVRRGTKKLL